MNTICYVSAYLDIGRGKWKHFTRTTSYYIKCFLPYIPLLQNENATMILFFDKNHLEELENEIFKLTGSTKIPNLKIIPIDDDFMKNNVWVWNKLEKEEEIMKNERYRSIVSHRLNNPEHSVPKYTLINHAKIDFVNLAMKEFDADYYCWCDFGYFFSANNIPQKLLDIQKLDKEKVNYILLNKIDDRDKNIIYTLQVAPEKIGGFFFFGNKEILKSYQALYHEQIELFQHMNIADDDQHIVLRCYFANPEMFALHLTGKWHSAFTTFSR